MYDKLMFEALPDALLYIWKECGIVAAALEKAAKNTKSAAVQSSPAKSQLQPTDRHASQPSPGTPKAGQSVCAELLVTPVLCCLYTHACEFYDQWAPELLQRTEFEDLVFVEGNGDLKAIAITDRGECKPEAPPKLLATAAAALWSQPDEARKRDLRQLAVQNQALSDVILSANKTGYGVLSLQQTFSIYAKRLL
jgi:hypothetical protein